MLHPIAVPKVASGNSSTKTERTSLIISQLGLPNDCQIEFVNGGHGIKNPLAIESQRQAAVTRDEDRTNRTPPGKVTYIIKYVAYNTRYNI